MQLLAGGLAGGAAAAVTNPLDVVKTRLQTAGLSDPTKYGSGAVVSAVRMGGRGRGIGGMEGVVTSRLHSVATSFAVTARWHCAIPVLKVCCTHASRYDIRQARDRSACASPILLP